MAMNTSQTMQERADYAIGVPAQDVGTADITGPWYSMAEFGRVAAVAVSEEVTADDTLTVQLRKATDSDGTGPEDLGDLVTVTATGAEALTALAEAKASDLGDGFTHVAVQIGGSATGTVAAATLIRADGRFRP